MKPTNRVICFLVIGLCVALGLAGCVSSTTQPTHTAAPSPTAAAGEIILVTGEWVPYTSEAMPEKGAYTELVSAVFAELGLTPHYVFYPWKRAEDEVRAGRAFAAFPYAVTEERKQEFDFSDPVMASTGLFFYFKKFHPDPIAYEKLEDLQPYKIGGALGYWYEGDFKAAGLQVEYVSADRQNIEKLYLGRIDLTVVDDLQGWMLIKELYPAEADQFGTLDKPLNQSSLSLMISRAYPNSAALLTRFNTALKAIQENGIYQKIIEKYGLGK